MRFNLIDLLLVVFCTLTIVIMQNPLNPFSATKAIIAENPGETDMRIAIKDGQELTRYEPTGNMGEGSVFAPE